MTAKHIYVTPAAGLLIPDMALGNNLPPEGRLVEDADYWQRRAAEGSVTISAPPAAKAPAKEKGN